MGRNYGVGIMKEKLEEENMQRESRESERNQKTPEKKQEKSGSTPGDSRQVCTRRPVSLRRHSEEPRALRRPKGSQRQSEMILHLLCQCK